MTKRWRGALVALSASAALGCAARKAADDGPKSSAPKPVSVTVAPIERRTVERTVDVVGTLKGWEEVTVGSKRMGRVLKVLHDIGDRVKPGEPLVELDRIDDDAAVLYAEQSLIAMLEQVGLRDMPAAKLDRPGIPVVDQARTAIEKARKEFAVTNVPGVVQSRFALEKARQNFARERALRQRGAGTPQDYQNAEIDEHAAEAAVANAELNARVIFANAIVSRIGLEIRKVQRDDMTIRVPVPRRPRTDESVPVTYAVTKRAASEGQMLKEGEAVADLVIEDPLRLMASVPEKFAADVKVGQEVRIAIASYPGRTFTGKVLRRINPSVDTASRTLRGRDGRPQQERLAPARRLRQGGDRRPARRPGGDRPHRVGRPLGRDHEGLRRRRELQGPRRPRRDGPGGQGLGGGARGAAVAGDGRHDRAVAARRRRARGRPRPEGRRPRPRRQDRRGRAALQPARLIHHGR